MSAAQEHYESVLNSSSSTLIVNKKEARVISNKSQRWGSILRLVAESLIDHTCTTEEIHSHGKDLLICSIY